MRDAHANASNQMAMSKGASQDIVTAREPRRIVYSQRKQR